MVPPVSRNCSVTGNLRVVPVWFFIMRGFGLNETDQVISPNGVFNVLNQMGRKQTSQWGQSVSSQVLIVYGELCYGKKASP